MHSRTLFWLLVIRILLACPGAADAATHTVQSPGGVISVKVETGDLVTWSVRCRAKEVLSPSPLSMTLADGDVLGRGSIEASAVISTHRGAIAPAVPLKRSVVRDDYTELTLRFARGYGIVFRVYDDGAAYRFFTEREGQIAVTGEEALFRFPANHRAYVPFEESFLSHFERSYTFIPLDSIDPVQMAVVPTLVDAGDGVKALITEADLDDYPGLFLKSAGNHTLFGVFPQCALTERQVGDRTVEVAERDDCIARTRGRRVFPWRVLIVTERDGDLVGSDMTYRLAPPQEIEDVSWIRPGKVAWDWWNANNLSGVDFPSGLDTRTYKQFINFAARYGIEYIILDEGWSSPSDLFAFNPAMDVPELVRYGAERGVGVILWCLWNALDRQLDAALDRFAAWGVKGVKVDFMQRDDQEMVNFYVKTARAAAGRKFLVDFHGAHKPAGLHRRFPNVLTFEGVRGLEHNKWNTEITPEHDVTLPFTRMVAGPMDYTPGAMTNANERDFRPVFDRPMSQGTRAHQLAMYVVYESPLQMLADSPSKYLAEPEVMEFLSKVPTVWDDTVVLDGKVADYVVVARRRGRAWYIGAMTDWEPRALTIDCSFLAAGEYGALVFEDGANAARIGNDCRRYERRLTREDRLTVKLAPGGGWAAMLVPLGRE